MKATGKKRYLKMAMAGLPAVAITFGLASGSVLAAEVSEEDYKLIQSHKKKDAEKQRLKDTRRKKKGEGTIARGR